MRVAIERVRRAVTLPAVVKKGLASTYGNRLIAVLCTLGAVPVYLHYLGRAGYGVWLAVAGLVSYLNVTNLGITQATATKVGAAYVQGKYTEAGQALGSGLRLYLGLVAGVGALAIAAVLLFPVSVLFKTPPFPEPHLRLVVGVAVLGLLLELPLRIFPATLRVLGFIHVEQTLGAIQQVVRLGMAVTYLALGGGLVGLIAILALTNVVLNLSAFVALRYKAPELRIGTWHALSARQLVRPSGFYFLLQISGAVAFSTDLLVISARLGAAAVTPYGVAQRMTMLVVLVVSAIATNYGPLFLEAYGRLEPARLRVLFRKAVVLTSAVGVVAFGGLVLIGPTFIRAWVGSAEYVGDPTLIAMAAFVMVQAILAPADVLLTVTVNHKRYAIGAALEAALNLVLSLLLVGPLGVFGVMVATLVARLVVGLPVLLFGSSQLLRELPTG